MDSKHLIRDLVSDVGKEIQAMKESETKGGKLIAVQLALEAIHEALEEMIEAIPNEI